MFCAKQYRIEHRHAQWKLQLLCGCFAASTVGLSQNEGQPPDLTLFTKQMSEVEKETQIARDILISSQL